MIHARLASKLWAPRDDERLRSLAVAGKAVWQIAVDLERTVSAVRSRAERFRISLKRVAVARHLAGLGMKVKK
jgi:hypothetical protein